MRRLFPRLGLALVVALAGLQLVPVARTNPPLTGAITGVPPSIEDRLRRACHDCHSNETVWPWYTHIAPVSFLIAHDVTEGREDLNFSTWAVLGARRQAKLLRKIAETVDQGEMPPTVYVLMHPDARLDDPGRAELVAWARDAAERVAPAPGGPAAGGH